MGDPIGPPDKRGRGEESKRYRFSRRQVPRNIKVGSAKVGRTWHNESEEIPGIGV